MLCLECGAEGAEQGAERCALCGAPFDEGQQQRVRRHVWAEVERSLDRWRERGQLGHDVHAKLLVAAARDQADELAAIAAARAEAERVEVERQAEAARLEAVRQAEAARAEQAYREEQERIARERRAAEEAALAALAHEPRDGGAQGADAGARLYAGGADAPVGDALGTLTELDEGHAESGDSVLPVLYQNIGWFLGALFVLAGSIYGVREAWQSLGDVQRHLVVAGALFAYHAGFVGVGALLAKKSASAGKILSSIGLSLLPVVFVSLSALLSQNVAIGLVASLSMTALSVPLLASVGARYELLAPRTLAMALLPSLLLMLPLSRLGEGSWPRMLAPIAGALPIALLSLVPSARGVLLGVALYGAIALEIYALSGDPSQGAMADAGVGAGAPFSLWLACMALSLDVVVTREGYRARLPRFAPVAELLSIGALFCALLPAAFSGLSLGAAREAMMVSSVTAAACSAGFFVAARHRRAATHLGAIAAIIAVQIAARVARPLDPPSWALLMALSGGALFVAGRLFSSVAALLSFWGLAAGWASLVWGMAIDQPDGLRPLLTSALLLMASAHVAGGLTRPAQHYAGALFGLFGLFTYRSITQLNGVPDVLVVLLEASVAWGAAGLVYQRLVGRGELAPKAAPFDDMSLLALLAGALLAPAHPSPAVFALNDRFVSLRAALPAALPSLAIAGLLLLRAVRDHSRMVSLAGVLCLGVLAVRLSGASSAGQHAAAWAGVAVAATLVAALQRKRLHDADDGVVRRFLFGSVPLPFAARRWLAIVDGFATGSAVAVGFSVLWLVAFLGSIDEATRPVAVMGAAYLVATAALWFVTRALEGIGAHGSVAAFALIFPLAALAAVVNRLGRPLPPDLVAVRLTAVIVALYLLTRLLDRFGARLARLLDNEPAGAGYRWVPAIAMAVVTLLMGVDGWLAANGITPVVLTGPPLMIFGAGLGLLLCTPIFKAPALFDLCLAACVAAAPFAWAQRSLLGMGFTQTARGFVPVRYADLVDASALVAAPIGPAVDGPVALSAYLAQGMALAALSLGLLALPFAYTPLGKLAGSFLFPEAHEDRWNIHTAMRRWAAIAALLVVGYAWLHVDLLASLLITAAGLALVTAHPRSVGAAIAAVAISLALSAASATSGLVASWGAVAIAAWSLVVSMGVSALAHRGGKKEAKLVVGSAVALAIIALAVVHGLAASQSLAPLGALPDLADAALRGLSGAWIDGRALGLSLAVSAASLLVLAVGSTRLPPLGQLTGALAGAAVAASLGALCLETLAPRRLTEQALALANLRSGSFTAALLQVTGAELSLAVALGCALAHVANRIALARSHEPASKGLRHGRDAALLAVGLISSWFGSVMVASRSLPPSSTLAIGALALVACSLVSAHAAFSESTARHIYFIQAAIVGVYSLVRVSIGRDLPPEADAIFVVVFGFVLVGVTVQARRANIPPVAAATRIFAALMPIGLAVAMNDEQATSQAISAAGSALLYGGLAYVEKNRLFGTLGAVAANLALLFFALSAGLTGLEVHLLPLGLFVLALGHLYAKSLSHGARVALRLLGSLFCYLPAAWSITFQLGLAQDGRYPVVFGLICMLGIAAGIAFQIRAYLLLGTAFLVLDIVANLVHAGLRDHRLGFLLLSVSGLAILGTMVLNTVRKELIAGLVASLRKRLASYD